MINIHYCDTLFNNVFSLLSLLDPTFALSFMNYGGKCQHENGYRESWRDVAMSAERSPTDLSIILAVNAFFVIARQTERLTPQWGSD